MDVIEALNTRSTAKTYGAHAPTPEHLAIALQAAVRAPDHGRLRPWRFMVIEGDQRRQFAEILATSARARTPGLSDGDLERVRPLLDRMGTSVFHLGPVGAGHAMKCINNLITAVTFSATAEDNASMWKKSTPSSMLFSISIRWA